MSLSPLSLKPRIAFVVQRYGAEVNGGAESAARSLAEQLTQLAEVTVITSCATDYTSWANYYPSGISQLHGVSIHRFPTDQPRNWRKAAPKTNRLLHRQHSLADEEAWIREQGPYSTPLLQFISQSANDFDLFIFVTYLYATTYFGLPLVADKAILLPTTHDEPYLYLSAYAGTFQQPQLLIHLTQAEQQLVRRVMGHLPLPPQLVIGLGLASSLPNEAKVKAFRQKYDITGDFLLYAGRIAESKNVPQLLDYFDRFQLEATQPLQLVLIGQPHIPLPQRPNVRLLGFVTEEEKYAAMQAATLFVMPSLYESLSIVCLEAWQMGTAVLVNGECAVLKDQCRQSNGGLYYTSYDEFAATLHWLLANPTLRQQLGQAGQNFVQQRYNWQTVLAQYRAILDWATEKQPD